MILSFTERIQKEINLVHTIRDRPTVGGLSPLSIFPLFLFLGSVAQEGDHGLF